MNSYACDRVDLPLVDAAGAQAATLSLHPARRSRGLGEVPPLVDRTDDPDRVESAPAVELLEGATYVFRVTALAYERLRFEPSEFFDPDDETGFTGRVAPREAVGTVRVEILADEVPVGSVVVAVRPRKLEVEHEFAQMLTDLADWAAESVLQGFAPAGAQFGAAGEVEPATLYRRFAYLAARVMSAEFEAAIGRVLARPHRTWLREDEDRPPGRPQPPSTALARHLARPGPRVRVAGSIASLPRRISSARSEESRDTLPNRFVKATLQEWSAITAQVRAVLESRTDSGPVRRGLRETSEVQARLDAALGDPLFREVAELRQAPRANQVLLKAEGYRDLYRLAALVEAGLDVDIPDGVDPFSASMRNVSALYEFWVYLVMADVVGELCKDRSQVLGLFRASDDGLSLGLRAGTESRLRWRVERLGRPIDVELFFNRTFVGQAGSDRSVSWTRPMRPDCSLRVSAPDIAEPAARESWLHFDAKYRVDRLRRQFETPAAEDQLVAAADEEQAETVGTSRREDLLKMHAYRDAIRQSAGAYVLYPGNDDPLRFAEFHELLPGLGAFALRPAEGEAVGRTALKDFVDDALDHFAAQTTRHERLRYWLARIQRERGLGPDAATAFTSLERPAADIDVALGYVAGEAHAAWIARSGRYNVRSGQRRGAVTPESRVLAAPFLLLYDNTGTKGLYRVVGRWLAMSQQDLLDLGYPNPRGDAYLCARIDPVPQPAWVDHLDVAAIPRTELPGAPIVTTWLDLLSEARRQQPPGS